MSDENDNQSDSEVSVSSIDYSENLVEQSQRDMERNQLHAVREMHIETLNRFLEEIHNEDVMQAFTEYDLRIRKDRMKKHFNDMEQAHVSYRRLCMMASDDVYINLESQFMTGLAMIENRLKEQSSNEQGSFLGSDTSDSVPMHSRTHVIHVETARPPQIGTFNGNPSEWPAFRDLFIAEVHNKTIDPVKKLLYLQEACIEKAAATLGPWQPTADNYQAAWEVMKAAYNDEYHVIHGILGKMFAVQKREKESYESLREILDALNSGTRQLEAISSQPALWHQVWIHYAKQRLPNHTLDSWEQCRNRTGSNRMPTLEEFKAFLDTKSKGRREFEHETNWFGQGATGGKAKHEPANNRYKPYDKDRSQKHGEKLYPQRRVESSSSSGRMQCSMQGCNQTHFLSQCDQFKALSLTDRNDLVRKKYLCRCCLTTGHMSSACPRPTLACSKCPETKIKHHFRLCPKTTADTKPAVSNVKKTSDTSTS